MLTTQEGKVVVYVPAHDTILRRTLAPGCAIVSVSHHRPGDRILVDLEDNRYGSHRPTDNLEVYLDCLRRAAGRLLMNYPTVARMAVEADELIAIGDYDIDVHHLAVTNRIALGEWVKKP